MDRIVAALNPEASVYADNAYTDYKIEDNLKADKLLLLKIQRKGDSKRPDSEKNTGKIKYEKAGRNNHK